MMETDAEIFDRAKKELQLIEIEKQKIKERSQESFKIWLKQNTPNGAGGVLSRNAKKLWKWIFE